MTTRYADRTEVPSDKSRAEIERTLVRYKATAFAYAWSETEARIMFELADRRILFRLPLPDRNDRAITHTPSRGYRREPAAQAEAYERAVRQRWRALALVIKAKLEAVEAGISTVEQEFLAHVMLPDGSTVADWVAPQLATVYASQQMPALLPGSDGHG